MRDLGTRVVLVLRAQRGVLGRLGNPPDPDLALARQRPVGERTRAPNLNQAAKHLGVRKAALTRQVDHLEEAVGATLLETTPDPGGIILTPAGEKFAQEVPPVLAMLDRTSYDAVSADSVKSEETPGN